MTPASKCFAPYSRVRTTRAGAAVSMTALTSLCLNRTNQPMRPFLRRFLFAAPFLIAPLFSQNAAHAADYLAAEPMAKVNIDGMLREWPGGFIQLKSKGGSGNSALVGYDEKFIYLAAKIKDDKLVRTPGAGPGEDHLSLEILFPAVPGQAQKTHRVDVYPGVPGKTAGAVKVDGRAVTTGQAIEAPSEGGFSLEARVPWAELSAAKSVRVGMRGKLSYHNATSVGKVTSISTSGGSSAGGMQPLTIGPETGLAQALLEPKGLGFVPAREAYGDLSGKGDVERVALYGHFLSIVGPGYKGGKQFYFNELDVESADQVARLELLDVNGDGKDEIILQKRLGSKDKYREVVQVLQIGKDGAPLQVFFHEVSIVTPEGSIKNQIKVQGRGKDARIVISQGTAEGFDPGTYQEPTLGKDIPSALLPWQTVKSRSFGWKGDGLTSLEETSWEPKVSSKNNGASRGQNVAQKDAPPPPRPPTADEMLDRVYALYQQDRKVKRGHKPSFDFVTDVVEDKQMERVLIHDRDLVVFGKGFKQGLSYTFLTIGVKEPQHILSVTTRDLEGDGKAEIIVHAVLDAQASESLGGDVVSRQALFIYKVIGENLKRIFAAETARSLKGNRIMGSVAFLPSGAGTEIELRPLRALGWNQKSYPFPEDQHPAGGLEPLLLPWTTAAPRHYSFNGSEYVLK